MAKERRYAIMVSMAPGTKELLERVSSWPKEDQEELAEVVAEIEARRSGPYEASDEELRAIDEARAAVRRGEIASEDELQAVLRKYR